jgi:cytochrome c peroxidase
MRSYGASIACLLLAGCDPGGNLQKAPPANSADRVVKIEVPIGLPPIPFPPGSPPTEATIELGRRLFYDRNLSLDGSVACSSCHNPRFGFTDNRPVAEGIGGRKGARNSPAIFNAAYGKTFQWDGGAATLEEQVVRHISNVNEMAHSAKGLESKLEDNSIYRAMFERVYGPGPITMDHIAKAIAVFERIILSGNSLYDRFAFLGNRKALNQSAIRGLEIFTGRGSCANCHQIGKEASLFTDGRFHNTGVAVNARGDIVDLGRYNITKAEADRGAFKTPSLRGITQTRPYMHDGSVPSLAEVIEFYSAGGRPNRYLSKLIRPLNFTAQDKLDLIAFLESLSGEPVPHIGPPEGEQ